MNRGRAGRIGWNTLGLLVFVVIAFPVYWMIASAFKPDDELNGATPTWFSMHPTLSHFRDVTFPILRPIILILTSLSIIWDFGVFTQPFLLIDQTRINTTNELMGIYLYEEGYVKTDFGRGAAISILMLLIVALLSVVYVRKMVRTGDEAA